jgi:flagellar basal body-associated protein FliL
LKFTGIDTEKEAREEKERQRDFILEILSFVFKNVAPVIVILILGGIALTNFEKIFNHKEEVVEVEEEENQIPSFDPYLALQQNATNEEDFFQQEIQYTSPVDKKKSEIINTVFANPEEATKVLISYMKE